MALQASLNRFSCLLFPIRLTGVLYLSISRLDWIDVALFSSLCRDRELWSKLEAEPVDSALDSVYDYLDGRSTVGTASLINLFPPPSHFILLSTFIDIYVSLSLVVYQFSSESSLLA